MSLVSVLFSGANVPGGQTPLLSFSPGTVTAKVVRVQQLFDDVTTSHASFSDNMSSSFDTVVSPQGYLNQLNSSDWSKRVFLAILEIDD